MQAWTNPAAITRPNLPMQNRARPLTMPWPISVALPNSMAATRNGRQQAVRAAVSLPASEALKLHVVDVIADDVPDLLRKIDGRTVTVAGQPRTPGDRRDSKS